jgi:hypothetical protein
MVEERGRMWQALRQKQSEMTQMPLALLRYLRKPSANDALSQLLIALDDELQGAYLDLKDLETDSMAEEARIAAIRAMENERFELLSQLHGSNVSRYNQLTT